MNDWTAVISRVGPKLRLSWQSARVLTGLVWMVVVASLQTAGDNLIGISKRSRVHSQAP